MTSGSLLLLLALTIAPATEAAELDASALIERLARPAPATIAFTEVRFSPLLREPLVVSGQLGYLGKGSLDRRVTDPYREETRIRAGTVRVERESESTRSFSLERAPELQGLLAGFSALLAGDRAALEDDFSLSATGTERNWKLELVPLDRRVKRRLQRIEITGTADAPRCFAMIDNDERASIMLLGEAAGAELPDSPTREHLERLCTRR